MVVGNHYCKAANLKQSKAQFQLELSLTQFSPSLSYFNFWWGGPSLAQIAVKWEP